MMTLAPTGLVAGPLVPPFSLYKQADKDKIELQGTPRGGRADRGV